jgi:flagellar hook-associated protein 2
LGLRFDPVGGGQFKQMVKQIIEAESQPIHQIEAHKAKEQARLKLFQEFKTKFSGVDKALADLSTLSKFRELKVDLGDGSTLMQVTMDKEKAQPGSYNLQIDELASRTSVISNGFANADEPILGMGYVVMNMSNGESKEVYVDEDKASLRGVAMAINAQADSPVRASVIKDSSDSEEPWKLILSAKKDGAQNQIDIPDFYFMDGDKDLNLDDQREAKNAVLRVDGFPIELESNDVNDFLPGVNLHLKQAAEGKPFTMTISEDSQKMTGKIKTLVDSMNDILGFIGNQNKIDDHTDTTSTFAGDTSLTNIEYRLRNLLHEGFPVGNPDDDKFRWVHLNEIGVEFDKTGKVNFKEEKFTKALEKDFDGITEAITGEFGLAFQMKETISSYTRSGNGLLGVREQGIQARIKQMDQQIDEKTKRLEQRQQSLTDQFSRLEGTLANMQRQQAALSAMGGGGGGGGLVQQLLGG